jgi:hypothetical protein
MLEDLTHPQRIKLPAYIVEKHPLMYTLATFDFKHELSGTAGQLGLKKP